MRLLSLAAAIMLVGIISPAHAEAPVVVTSGELSRLWAPIVPVASPVYPVELVEKAPYGCVTIAYVIERDGATSSLVELARYSSVRLPAAKVAVGEAFARAAADAVAAWRFVPSGDPVRAFTASTVNFSMDGTLPPAGKCEVADLAKLQGLSEERIVQLNRAQWHQLRRDASGRKAAEREPGTPPKRATTSGSGNKR